MRKSSAWYLLDRDRIWKEQDYCCFYCKVRLKRNEATMDHVIPRKKTKTHSSANCVVACKKCNSNKGHQETFQPTIYDLMWAELDKRIENRIKLAEYRLSMDSKGNFKKWKNYWEKNGKRNLQ